MLQIKMHLKAMKGKQIFQNLLQQLPACINTPPKKDKQQWVVVYSDMLL